MAITASCTPSAVRRGQDVVRHLYAYPIINANGIKRHFGVSLDTAIAWLQKFEALGVVREITGQKRNRAYRFDRYIEILDAGWTARKAAADRKRSSPR